jgi:hypothetical protein
LNEGRLDVALHYIQEGIACALKVSPFNGQLRNLLMLAARAFERRPLDPPGDQRTLTLAAFALTLYAAADALDAAR